VRVRGNKKLVEKKAKRKMEKSKNRRIIPGSLEKEEGKWI
jgi:hypothetical protein